MNSYYFYLGVKLCKRFHTIVDNYEFLRNLEKIVRFRCVFYSEHSGLDCNEINEYITNTPKNTNYLKITRYLFF